MSSQRLVLFDFDGTLTEKDTLFAFIRYYHGTTRFLLGFMLLSPMLVLFKLGFIKNHKAKQFVLQYFFRHVPLQVFNDRCAAFACGVVPSLVRPHALDTLQQHLAAGATVAVVSASPENWVKPWCDQWNIRCLATRLEVSGERLTGCLQGQNCYGPEKVNRVKEAFDLSQYTEIVAYGDSGGDTAMLAIAHQPHYRFF